MLTDGNLQTTKWASHIPSDGSLIDPGAPDPDYHNQIIYQDGSSYCYLEGKVGAACEWYLERPFIPGLNPTLSFQYIPDPDDVQNSQWRETDLILCRGGLKFNLSAQLYQNQIQVGTPAAGWASTGVSVPTPLPNLVYNTRIAYSLNATTCSVLSYTINGVVYEIPAKYQNCPAESTTWPDMALIQVQKKLTAQGRAGFWLQNLALSWA